MENSNNIFIFDIDGTLLKPSDNRIDDKAIEAIKKASHFGKIILASARPLKGITNLYSASDIKVDHIIALNGALISTNENSSKSFPIQSKVSNYFLTNSQIFKNLWFFTVDFWYSNNLTSTEYSVEKNAVSFNAVSLDNYNHEPVLKITLVDERDFEKLNSISNDIEVTISNEKYIEIQSKQTNKFLASKNLFGDDVRMFAFGDSNNDFELLKNVFFGCAVANATPQVKSVSKFISEFQFGEGVLDSVNFVTNKFFN